MSSSWAWRVFKQHNIELLRMYTSFYNSRKYTYKSLGNNGAKWEDLPSYHFEFEKAWEYEQFKDLHDWSQARQFHQERNDSKLFMHTIGNHCSVKEPYQDAGI